MIAQTRVAETKGLLTGLRTLWFALAFLGGQAFNVLWTLLLAYLLFGGMFFAVPALR